jgi:myo-inositol-1(or 4)-monophosphatase
VNPSPTSPRPTWTADAALSLFDDTANAVTAALASLGDRTKWGLLGTSGAHAGQHGSDVVADAAALEVLDRAGVGVLSEESGLSRADHPLMVIVDPLDGSTNASRGIPWYATSLAAVDADGLLAALVVNQASGERYWATRGGGAFADGRPMKTSECPSWRKAITGLSGLPSHWLGWSQFRALGACALDLCAVAGGVLDAYVDCSRDAHGVWDYAGGMLILQEAGGFVADAFGRDLIVLDPDARRTPIAANSEQVGQAALAARHQEQPNQEQSDNKQ